jgi:hypothetical protein
MAWTPPASEGSPVGFTSYLSPTYIEQSQFIPEAPRLTAAQKAAIETLLATADSDGLRVEFMLQVRRLQDASPPVRPSRGDATDGPMNRPHSPATCTW